MATSAPSSARLTVSSCTFFELGRKATRCSLQVRNSIAASPAAMPDGSGERFKLGSARETRPPIFEDVWKALAPEHHRDGWRMHAGILGDLPGSRKGFPGVAILERSARIAAGLSLRGIRFINRPFDYLRVPNMTFPKRERRRRYFIKRLQERAEDKGWHPELCTYESEFAKQHALYFYNILAFPWEKGAFERFMDKLERKYFPEGHIDTLVPPLDKDKEKKKPSRRAKQRKEPLESRSSSLLEDANEAQCHAEELQEPVTNAVSTPASPVSLEIAPDDWEPEANASDTYVESETVKSTTSDAPSPRPPVLIRGMQLPEDWEGPLGTVVLIDKPQGWTSFSVCAKLRKLIKVQKVGHAGTLDPMATGLLIVCIGKATKFTDSYQAMRKVYSGTLRLGEATPSYDAETLVSERLPWEHVTDEDMQIAKEEFVGTIRQVPPLYSALKVEGERLYEKARRGETFQMPPRLISIDELQIERDSLNRQDFHFKVVCSKGTYVRSLCYDLGRALNTCAHMIALRREKIGEFSVDDAWNFSELGRNFADDFYGNACPKTPSPSIMNMSLDDAWKIPELQQNLGVEDDF